MELEGKIWISWLGFGDFSLSQARKIPRKKIPGNCCTPEEIKSWECASLKSQKLGKLPQFLMKIPRSQNSWDGSGSVGSQISQKKPQEPLEFPMGIAAPDSGWKIPGFGNFGGFFFPCFFEFQWHRGFSLIPKKKKKSRIKTLNPQNFQVLFRPRTRISIEKNPGKSNFFWEWAKKTSSLE